MATSVTQFNCLGTKVALVATKQRPGRLGSYPCVGATRLRVKTNPLGRDRHLGSKIFSQLQYGSFGVKKAPLT